jgi:hypothetical protein
VILSFLSCILYTFVISSVHSLIILEEYQEVRWKCTNSKECQWTMRGTG